MHAGLNTVTSYQVVGGDGFSVLVARHHHVAESLTHVFQVCRQSEDSHDLTSNRDVKLTLKQITKPFVPLSSIKFI